MTFDRPPAGRDRQCQTGRNPARVPADDGAGFYEDQDLRPAGPTLAERVQKNRSKEFSVGLGRFRLKPASCCRRAKTFRAVSLRLRKKTRMATRKDGMISSTNSPFLARRNVASLAELRNRKMLIPSHHGLLSTDVAGRVRGSLAGEVYGGAGVERGVCPAGQVLGEVGTRRDEPVGAEPFRPDLEEVPGATPRRTGALLP